MDLVNSNTRDSSFKASLAVNCDRLSPEHHSMVFKEACVHGVAWVDLDKVQKVSSIWILTWQSRCNMSILSPK